MSTASRLYLNITGRPFAFVMKTLEREINTVVKQLCDVYNDMAMNANKVPRLYHMARANGFTYHISAGETIDSRCYDRYITNFALCCTPDNRGGFPTIPALSERNVAHQHRSLNIIYVHPDELPDGLGEQGDADKVLCISLGDDTLAQTLLSGIGERLAMVLACEVHHEVSTLNEDAFIVFTPEKSIEKGL
jgi:hypothetical protein